MFFKHITTQAMAVTSKKGRFFILQIKKKIKHHFSNFNETFFFSIKLHIMKNITIRTTKNTI